MIGSFASGANVSLVAKNGTKKIIPLVWTKPSPVDRFWCLRCLNNCIDLPYMIGSFASGTKDSLVAKNGTKKYSTTVDKIITSGQISEFEVSKRPYMMGSLASGATNSLVAKIGTKDFATSCLVYRY